MVKAPSPDPSLLDEEVAMSVISASGLHQPYEDPEDYGLFGDRTPALRGFRFTHANTDHQLVDIAVRVGGDPVDLTPNADPKLLPVLDGDLDVEFQDASPSGDEFAYSVSHSLLNIRGARRYQIRDVGCVDQCKRVLPAQVFGGRLGHPPLEVLSGYILALTGFRLFFTGNRNHEVERIGVWFEGHELHVALSDHSRNDTFAYFVDFVVIPSGGLTTQTGSERGAGALGSENFALATPPRSHFLIRGWELHFTQGDRELRDIGVVGTRAGFTVILADNSASDPFDWRVDWAHVGPTVLAAPALAAPGGP